MTRADQRKFHYIYKITRNDGSGKYYIGMHSTDDLEDGYFGSGSYLWHSIKKHGKEKHSMEILEFLPSRQELRLRESQIVDEKRLKDPLCMNLKTGGEGGAQSDPAVLKMISEKAKLRVGEKNSFYGKSHTEATKQKIGEAHAGKTLSEEHKRKLSELFAGRGGEWSHTEETKARLKKAWEHRRLTPVSEETRKKMSAARSKNRSTFVIISPSGEGITTNDLKAFCEGRGLSYSTFVACAAENIIPQRGKNQGWKCVKVLESTLSAKAKP